ncbi:SH3 domain-containing protein [Irregularibacter muris]|uniref:SH3 domain-containing protein n=2 Tax=Irregularibacter muris TaxID=1796619 RepID=A0AAE3HF56_9FIRM|nr:SH3 domain-containing protein [Irregularibacter muris]
MVKKGKMLLMIILMSLSIIGCNIVRRLPENPPAQQEEQGKDSSEKSKGNQPENHQNIEENINDENIEEDKELTEKARREKRTEEDNVISPEDIQKDGNQSNQGQGQIQVLEEFNTTIPDRVTLNLKYDQYAIPLDYFLVTTETLNIRKEPHSSAPVVYQANYFEKLNVLQRVKGEFLPNYQSDNWYKVALKEGDKIQYGYVFGSLGEARSFHFDKMLNEVNKLQERVLNNDMAYIYNYQNVRGLPPAHNGNTADDYKRNQDQSAPGYIDEAKTDFRYFSDGMLVSILEDNHEFYKVSTPSFEGQYWIPKKYVHFGNAPKEITKVIVIDDTNQNEAVFELIEGKWNIISYTFATTGVADEYKYETPKGHFMAIQRREQFLYLKDGTNQIAGYAPYAIRFSGGGYVHGVPVDYQFTPEGEKIDPGHQEYLFTIGTTPRSHKCVRNYTSHAKFLYDWMEIGKGAVIIID